MENREFIIEVRNKYLAEGLSFLGLEYFKHGYGKDTIYTFKDTREFRIAMQKINALKKELGLYKENTIKDSIMKK